MPLEIFGISEKLRLAGHKAYLVGGCVRDLLLGPPAGGEPKDWDIATDAMPEKIQEIFPDSVYENDFGTVGVKTDSEDPRLKIIEITTFRLEGRYTDKRHPDEVRFARSIQEDLSRRDFTVNAMALPLNATSDMQTGKNNDAMSHVASPMSLVDPYGGRADLKDGIIRTVGDPDERFKEDALRLLRAVRFAVQLDFQIELNTRRAIGKNAGLLEVIAKERIRDELEKIMMCRRAADGILLLEELNLLRYVLPELREGLGMGQNKHHIYTVFEHNLRALDYAAKQNYSFLVRLASLLHDVGKPRVKSGEGPESTFYGHEVVGAKMTLKIMDRLRFSGDFTEKVAHLVRYHLFYYNVGEVTEAGVRRFLRRAGPENIDDLIKVREADRIGSGVPKAVPYKLRHLLFMIEKVKHDPLGPKMLKVNGNDLMEALKIKPGPKVGQILNILLEEVLDNPQMNTPEALLLEAKRLDGFSPEELERLSRVAKGVKEEFEAGVEKEMKGRFHV